MEQFKPGIYIARDSKKVKYGGEYEGSWLSRYSFVEPEDFEKVASKLKSGKTGDRPIYTKLKTYHKDIWNSIQKNFGIKEEKFSLSDIIEIQEEVKIEQDGKKIILEKGDKIKVLEASFNDDKLNNELLSLLSEFIQGYGGPGYSDSQQYFDVLRYILGFVANDLNDLIRDNFDLSTDKDKLVAKTLISTPIKNFQRFYP